MHINSHIHGAKDGRDEANEGLGAGRWRVGAAEHGTAWPGMA